MVRSEWNFVAVNAGYGDSGFFFNESGLQWNEYPGDFGGWLGEFLVFLICYSVHETSTSYPSPPLPLPHYMKQSPLFVSPIPTPPPTFLVLSLVARQYYVLG